MSFRVIDKPILSRFNTVEHETTVGRALWDGELNGWCGTFSDLIKQDQY